MERVKDPADPERCKGASVDGQCENRAEHGSEYCLAHGGKSTALAEARRSYLLVDTQRRARLAELSEPEGVKSLREEIALAKLMIEKRINSCKTDEEFINASSAFNTLLLTLERLKKTDVQLEQTTGSLIHKNAVLRLAQMMCQIVIEELEHVPGYEAIVDRIGQRLIQTISKANNADVPALTGPAA